MNIKTKVIGHLFGLVALLIAGQVSAALVSLTPSDQYVNVGENFFLTVHGSGFDNGVTSGGVKLTWDDSQFELITTSISAIQGSLVSNAWTTFSLSTIQVASNKVEVDAVASDFLFGIAGPNFDMFTLEFKALEVGLDLDVDFSASSTGSGTGGFQDTLGGSVDETYAGANIDVGTVPVPAAAWLFGSGLIGLVGVSRRSKSQRA